MREWQVWTEEVYGMASFGEYYPPVLLGVGMGDTFDAACADLSKTVPIARGKDMYWRQADGWELCLHASKKDAMAAHMTSERAKWYPAAVAAHRSVADA